MVRDGFKAFIQAGAFFFIGGAALALLQPRDSGEFVVSICSSGIGLALVILGVILVRVSNVGGDS